MPLRKSRGLTLWIALVAGSAAGLTFTFLPLTVGVPVILLLLTCLRKTLRRYAWLTDPSAVVAVRWGNGHVSYQLKSGLWLKGTLQNGGFVSHWVTLARVRDDGPQGLLRNIMLTPDNLSTECFRLCRQSMRWDQRSKNR